MKIAISADCFASFTSGFPVRGMTLSLIKNNPDIDFILLFTKRKWPNKLDYFYKEILSLPNVEIRYFKDGKRTIAIKRMLLLKYVKLENDINCFLNPGHIEYITNFKGIQICSLADLSTIKGLSTYKYAMFYKYWNRLFYKHTLPKLNNVVVISNYTGKDLINFYPSIKNKVKCIYNGIDPFWQDDKYSTIDLTSVGINGKYFIWWGLISRRKNIERLISAYKLAKTQQSNLPKLLLVGKVSDYLTNIKKEFNSDIINIPFQDNYTLKWLVKNSKGLIFPSLYEGFGLPIIEAFSQGINVACSNTSSLPEIANNHAILFDPLNVTSITNAIISLNNKDNQSQQLQEYSKKFTYDKAAENYLQLIKSNLE